MMKSNITKLILILILVIGIPSCEKDCDCCDISGPTFYNARIIDFDIDKIDKQIAPTEWESYNTGDTVNANGDVVIYLDSFHEEIVFHKKKPSYSIFIHSLCM